MSVSLLLLTVAYLGVIYFSHDLQRFSMLFNADSLYLPALLNNLLNENGAYSDWYLPPAPYFFPDLPLYLLAFVLSKNVYIAQFIFAILQGVLVSIALFGLNRLFFSRTQAFLHTVLVLALMYLSVLGQPTIHAIISGHHFGAFVAILMGLFLFARLIQSDGHGLVWSVLLGLLIGLTVASDKLFIVQFVMPLIVTMALLRLFAVVSTQFFFKVFFIAVFGLIIGYLFYYLWVPNPTGFTPNFSIHHLTDNLPLVTTLFHRVITNNYLYSAVFFGFYGILSITLIKALFNKNLKNKGILELSLLIASITSITVLTVAFSDLTIDFRYFIPVFFIPLLLVPLLFIVVPSPSRLNLILPRLSLLLTMIVISFHLWQKRIQPLKADYYPPAVQCFDNFIDTTKAHRGISHYWDAKRTALLSKNKVTIAAYTPHLTTYNWISTSQWQHSRYDFVLVRNKSYPQYQLDPDLIKQYSPKQTIGTFSCGLFDIHYFPQGLYTKPRL
ncbi:hypothetical protein [Marinicella gelatinilytica]|uniref:hypothetical protein n=1 Tax=Marinicella gelatinilytica TaxID=2996017 RepID=UPI002260C7DB|nr:hypothetical protein [Marinicella gelatinilytica]MCX7544471.1 hypothetical protein [Marinicella gelatinilytica]